MIQSEREVMAKVHKQLTMNNLFDSLLQFPKLAQELTYRTTYIDGRVTRTLGDGTDINKAKDVIIKMVDGKPQVMQINKSFINTLELVFTPVEKG